MQLTSWYDIGIVERFLCLLRDVDGDGSNDYLRRRGAKAAEHRLRAGLYQQLEYLSRMQVRKQSDPHARHQAFGKDLRLLVTLSASAYNFTRWHAKADPDRADRYAIEISEARAFPDVLCWTTGGFVHRMADQHQESDLWRWQRIRGDLVLYRMKRAF